jgi:hypothetical protein
LQDLKCGNKEASKEVIAFIQEELMGRTDFSELP